MRKFVAFLSLSFALFFCNAQSQHASFMGVSMNTSLSSFVDVMKQKGFSVTESLYDEVKMRGRFSGELVDIEISATPKTRLVASVQVRFKTGSSEKFLEFKKKLDSKYGYGVRMYEDENYLLDNIYMYRTNIDASGFNFVYLMHMNVTDGYNHQFFTIQ